MPIETVVGSMVAHAPAVGAINELVEGRTAGAIGCCFHFASTVADGRVASCREGILVLIFGIGVGVGVGVEIVGVLTILLLIVLVVAVAGVLVIVPVIGIRMTR